MSTLFSKALVYLGLVDEEQANNIDYEYDGPAGIPDERSPLKPVANSPEGRRVEPPVATARTAATAEPRIIQRIEPMLDSSERRSLRSNTGSVVTPMNVAPQASVLVIEEFGDAKILADWTRDGVPVVIDLRMADSELTRRVVDFSSGLIYALDGKMKKVGGGLVLVTPSGVELSDGERRRLADLGAYEDLD